MRDRAGLGVDLQRGAARFPQQLAAATARRERLAGRAVDARERDEPATAATRAAPTRARTRRTA